MSNRASAELLEDDCDGHVVGKVAVPKRVPERGRHGLVVNEVDRGNVCEDVVDGGEVFGAAGQTAASGKSVISDGREARPAVLNPPPHGVVRRFVSQRVDVEAAVAREDRVEVAHDESGAVRGSRIEGVSEVSLLGVEGRRRVAVNHTHVEDEVGVGEGDLKDTAIHEGNVHDVVQDASETKLHKEEDSS
jgi:hypothetical protein